MVLSDTHLMIWCMLGSGDILQSMTPVLLQHANQSAGLLAWHGIMAVATAAAQHLKTSQPQSQSQSQSHPQSQSISPSIIDATAAQPPSTDRPQEPHNSLGQQQGASDLQQHMALAQPGISLGNAECSNANSALWAILPDVMAYASLPVHYQGQILSDANSTAQQNAPVDCTPDLRLESVLRLLKTDPMLIKPYIGAVVAHCKQHLQKAKITDSRHQQHLAGSQQDVSLVSLLGISQDSKAEPPSHDVPQITAASDVSGSIVYTAEALLLLAQQQDLAAHLLGLQQQLMAASRRLR